MRVTKAAIIFLGVAACTPVGDSSETPSENATSASTASGSPAPTVSVRTPAEPVPARELVGEWRIAGVDGAEIDAPYAVTASITTDRIHVVADCINLAWSYAAEGGSITAKRIPVEGCGRGLTPVEEAIVAALDGATGFERTPANAIEIFSQQHRITLFSQ